MSNIRISNAAAIGRLKARLEGVSEARLQTAAKRSLVSVQRKFEPAAKRVIRSVYNVKISQLSGKFKVRTSSDADGEFVELSASTRGVPLLSFGARWGGRARLNGQFTPSATATVQLGQGKTYESAFIASVGGKRHVLARQFSRDSNSPSGRDPRNKLRRLMGPSPAQMTEGFGEQNAKRIAGEMNSFLTSEIRRQLALARKAR